SSSDSSTGRPRYPSGTSSCSSGYWMVTVGRNMLRSVTAMPISAVRSPLNKIAKPLSMSTPPAVAGALPAPRPLSPPQHVQSRPPQIDQRQRNEDVPAEVHEVVNANARQRPPDPHGDEDHSVRLDEKPDDGREERTGRPAQEKRRGQSRENHQIRVFGQEKDGPPKAAVLGVVAGHQLAFRLGQVKGRPVGFGQP